MPATPVSNPRSIPALRWWIGGLLFASTVINYIDRQTLSVLAPYLKLDYQWTNEDYAQILICFRIAYALGQTLAGRLIDRMGTRKGLTITVIWYSIATMMMSVANGRFVPFSFHLGAYSWAISLSSFMAVWFLVGLGESANWPAATKAVSEWFPKRERGIAVALFDSGSSIGGAITPFLVVWLYKSHGWRPAFILVGLLGFLWLAIWRWIYYPPESHPRVSDQEKAMILADKQEAALETGHQPKPKWIDLLKFPQTWGAIAARALTDPVWFFIADWFFIYLKDEKHVNPERSLLAAWIPFIAADLGNFFGGFMSSWLIRRGWPVGRARKALVVFGGLGMTMLIPTIFTSNLFAIAAFFAIATFCYASYSTMALVLPSDLFPSESVASVSGLCGTGAGILTIAGIYTIGKVTTRFSSFAPIIVGGSIIPLIGVVLVFALVRNTKATEKGLLHRI